MPKSTPSFTHSTYTARSSTVVPKSPASRPSSPGAPIFTRPKTSNDISNYALPNIKLVGPQADELEALIYHYDALLEQRDNQIMQLTSQLESEQRRNAMLESELGLSLAASQRAEAAHAVELAAVEGDVARVLAERRGLLEKLAGIEVVEDAVREMVVQMKVRRGAFRVGDDESPPPEQLQAEKEALREENILTVLGSLKAILKTLWTFKVEAEEDLRCSRAGRQQQQQQQVLSLKARIREMEAAVRAAQQEQEAARQLAAQEAAARSALLAESREALGAMEAQHAELLAALRAATEEAAAARRALAAAQEEGRRRDALVLRNQQLESARHFDRVAQDRELRLMQTAHTRQIMGMQSELARISDLMLRHDELAGKLQQATARQQNVEARLRSHERAAELERRQEAGSARRPTPDLTRPSSSPSARTSANPSPVPGSGPGAGPNAGPSPSTTLLRPSSASAALRASHPAAGGAASGPTGPGPGGAPGGAAGGGGAPGGGHGGGPGGGHGAASPRSHASFGAARSATARPTHGSASAATAATAMKLMTSRRAVAEQKAKAAAEVLESQDPVYQTLTNVNKLHRGVKSYIKDIKRDLADAAPSWAKARQQQAQAVHA
ncbi:hypothetical protein GPECTOR_23g17 [Gonium pectorale]|uniref:Uncharacterized protein n=1 Tax=Gonium pectorale TaxID=33097 RepID=A0A150GGY9_GONPE|nr:hypothetical protein GPECTOR_23g17 [Gonium pectorale]|eukprot:KXZ49084.1 hypothetical protein GPECTOR_23g17 [Gonium pectorale]